MDSEVKALMEWVGDKVDRNRDDIKALSERLDKYHHALVGNGNPAAFYVRLISVEHTVNKFQMFLEGLMDTQSIKMKEFDETLDKMDSRLSKMDGRLDRLEKLEISIKGRVWGIVAVVSLVWSVAVLLLGWLVFK